MVVRTSGFCVRVQADDFGAALVFHSAAAHNDHVHSDFRGSGQDTDRWIAATVVLFGGHDALELFCGLLDEYIDNVCQQREFVWQSVLSTACGSIVGGPFESDSVSRSVFFISRFLCVVRHRRKRSTSQYTGDPILDAAIVGVDGIVRVGGRDCDLIDDDQVSRFSAFGYVRGSAHDVRDARDLSHVCDPRQVSMDHPLQSDVSHH